MFSTPPRTVALVPASDPHYQEKCFELEKEAIFKRSWMNISPVGELPETDDPLTGS